MGEITADAPWARRTASGWTLTIRVQPGARRSEWIGTYGDAVRVRVAAPAVDGKANEELLRFLAAELGVARRNLRIVHGAASRSKVVEVVSADARR